MMVSLKGYYRGNMRVPLKGYYKSNMRVRFKGILSADPAGAAPRS